MKIRITLADGKIVRGERGLWDYFADGWSNMTVHNAKIYDESGALLRSTRTYKPRNHWIVATEHDEEVSP